MKNMERGEMARIIIEMAWNALSDEDSQELLDHYGLTEKDIQEFLALGEQEMNGIDQMLNSH